MESNFVLILILVTITQCWIIKNLPPNLLTFAPKFREKNIDRGIKELDHEDAVDIKSAKRKASVLQAARKGRKDQKNEVIVNALKRSQEKQHYILDPVLNLRKSKILKERDYWEDDKSSSRELRNWRDEWRELWLQKKFEAINASRPKGDFINMVAARPWGVPCGDPNQHDMSWGTCMLPMECDPEFRIFRGDYFCGRTQFVCCALQFTTYDMYQGFDVSFADSSLETDSEEKRMRNTGSKERQRRKQFRERQKRRRNRLRRKRRMKRNIQKIVRQIKKILNRHYRNATTERSRKTRQLKKFIQDLKEKFIEERKVLKDLHEINIVKANAETETKMNQIKALNEEFMKNDTFRQLIINGTISKKDLGFRALMENYPELASMLQTRRGGGRRPRDYLDYDIEYGYLYY